MARFRVNGEERTFEGDPEMPLLWFLRDVAGLRGTKYGCGQGLCGACTVHVDGRAVRSCKLAMGVLGEAEVTTIEGLSTAGDHPLQLAWRDQRVPQCGFCQSGQIMQAAQLLVDHPEPSERQIVEAMAGNLCRCGTYLRIRRAIRQAAGEGA